MERNNDNINFVKAEGRLDSPIAFVGEAPGDEEIRVGRPFIGPSGRLLDRFCASVGIIRNRCFITNVVKEQPPGNKIDKFITISNKGRVKTTDVYNEYEQLLFAELDKCSANVIVPLGRIALYAVCRRIDIMKRRGSIIESVTLSRPRKVVPTIHPAGILRKYSWHPMLIRDLQRAKHESEFPELRLPQRQMYLSPSFDWCVAYIKGLMQCHTPVAFDIEVIGRDVACIAFATDPFESCMCIPFIAAGGRYFPPDQEAVLWKLIGHVLESPNVKKVGQFVVFDVAFLFHEYGIRTVNVEDTMTAIATTFHELPRGLDFITSMYTDEPYYKDEGKKYFKLSGSWDAFWKYNAKDACVTLESFPHILEDCNRLNNLSHYKRQADLIAPLTYMQERGMRVDTEKLADESKRIGLEIERLSAEFNKLTGGGVDPNSPKQLMKYFYFDKGTKVITKRTTGRVTTDERALERLATRGFEEAKILLDIRGLSKMKSTYLDVTLDDDNRLRGSFNPAGTNTGRLSSSESIFGTGTNLQNLPDSFRRFVKADVGYKLYSIDLAQAENRVVAYIAPEPKMIHAFESGIDLHKQTAALMFHKRIEDVTTKEGTCHIGSGKFSERYWGKRTNHAVNYGMRERKFAENCRITVDEALLLINAYLTSYPGLTQYHSWVQAALRKDRTLVDCFGKRRKFFGMLNDDTYRKAYDYIPQSTVARKTNEHGILFVWENQRVCGPVELLNQIHDSIVFQIPETVEERYILSAIVESLSQPIRWGNTSFVLLSEVKSGYNFGEYDKDTNPLGMKNYDLSAENN